MEKRKLCSLAFSRLPSRKSKLYKHETSSIISNRKIVSMIPGDLAVAGCFSFYKNTLIFVDDGFFGLVKKHFQKKNKKIRYLQTFRNVCKKEKLNLKHVFIYTAPPYQSPKPTRKENFLMSNYQNMTRMLRKKNWITLREGRCQRIINEKGKHDFRQKGVDALIIRDLFDIENKYPKIKKIIMLASDSDFVPVIERMKEKGFEIILYTYFDRERGSRFSTSNHLLKVASRWEKLKKEDFE